MKTLVRIFNKIILYCYDFLEGLAAVVIAAEIITVTTGIIFRYILGNSLSWVEEVCVLALIYLAYITAGLATVSKTHIVADFVSSRITGKPKIILSWIMRVLEIAFLLLICSAISKLLPNMTARSTVLEIPRVWYYFPIGIMSIFMAFATVVDMLNDIYPGFNYWRQRQDQREAEIAKAEHEAEDAALASAEEFIEGTGGENK